MTQRSQGPAISTLGLAWLFLKVGVSTFGETGPLLAVIERELVEKRKVLTRDDVSEALTYTQLLPGSTVVQIVAYLTYTLAGWSGSALCTTAYLLPAVVMMLLLAAGYVTATAIPAVGPVVQGLTAAVVGILLATAYRLGQRNIRINEPITVALALAALVAGAVVGLNAALIVVGGGVSGILLLRPRRGTEDAGVSRR